MLVSEAQSYLECLCLVGTEKPIPGSSLLVTGLSPAPVRGEWQGMAWVPSQTQTPDTDQ